MNSLNPNPTSCRAFCLVLFFLSVVLQVQAQVPASGASAANSGERAAKPPTEITATKVATFDEKSHTAVFSGSVHVKDSQFDLTSDTLTAYLKKQSSDPGDAARSEGKADGKALDANKGQGGGLDRAVAEGNVVIFQEKPGEKPGATTRYVAKAARADYDARTGDLKLSGWPEVQQGINTHIATSEATVMYLNRGGKMRTEGSSKTVIQEQIQEKHRP